MTIMRLIKITQQFILMAKDHTAEFIHDPRMHKIYTCRLDFLKKILDEIKNIYSKILVHIMAKLNHQVYRSLNSFMSTISLLYSSTEREH